MILISNCYSFLVCSLTRQANILHVPPQVSFLEVSLHSSIKSMMMREESGLHRSVFTCLHTLLASWRHTLKLHCSKKQILIIKFYILLVFLIHLSVKMFQPDCRRTKGPQTTFFIHQKHSSFHARGRSFLRVRFHMFHHQSSLIHLALK